MKAGIVIAGTALFGITHAWAAADYQAIQKQLGIPASVASVVDASGKDPQYIIIQDIHRHPEAQQNISAMIMYGLRHWGTTELFVEGSWAKGDELKESTPHFSSLLDAVREGRMGGAEMAVAMTPNPDLKFMGLEDADVYRQNVEAYEAVESARDDALRELETSRLLSRVFDSSPNDSCSLVKRLIQLRLKPSEYADYLQHPYHASPNSRLAEAVASAEHFYQVANERSRIFLEKAKAMHQSGIQVLVVGGFHTAAMTEQLRQEGISYVVLSPQITQGGYEDLYARGMHDTISALKLR